MGNSSKTFGKLTITLLLLLTISFSTLPAQAKYGGGTGEPNDPYLIFDADQMNTIGIDPNDWDKHFLLCADIDLSGFTGASFNIIGYCVDSWEDDKPFTGVFDGNGHTISNFSYTSTDMDYIGIFSYVNDFEAEIKNLVLIDPDVDAGTGGYVGSLVGWFRGGTMTDCYVEGAAVAGTEGVGGLVGQNGICYHPDECHGGKMSNCYSTGSVSGYWAVGGLVGKSNGGTIYNCYSDSVVSGTTGVGGLMGDNEEGAIFNSYSHSSVSGNEQVGGLLGSNNWGTVTSSYSTGGVSGDDHVGGLTGYNEGGWIESSFWDIQRSGQTDSAGGTDKTTAEMQDVSTFMEAGWDFVGEPDGPHDVWAEPAGGGYPILCWQLPPFFGLPGFSGGSGTAEDPYLISTADELNSIGHNPRLMAAHFKLIDDINLTGTDLFLIGSELFPFRGVFDGNGRKISNFTYSSTDADLIGLFTYVYGENAIIKDLGLITPDVEVGTGYYLGSLVGRLFEGNVTDCYVDGGSVSGNFCVGGLVGANNRGTINNCRTTAGVSGYFYVGGLLGYNYYGAIINSYSGADVNGDYYAGGLVGDNDWGSTITNCHTTGIVSGGGYVGGLVGHNWGTISNCNTTGTVSGSGTVGGLAGSSSGSPGEITKCYTTGDVGGGSSVGGLVGSNSSTMTDCYAAGDVRGEYDVGGLAGSHSHRTITNCCATGDVSGTGWCVGGLVGSSSFGTISNCYAKGSASGVKYVGGLAGWNRKGTISECYSRGGVSGTRNPVGGLVGGNRYGTITYSYSTGKVEFGGLVGENLLGSVSASFWDVNTSGQTTSNGGTGKTTVEMQMMSTFIDAGWDFNTPVWAIDEGSDYPRLWWEMIPVMHGEPEITLGTTNTIFWEPVCCDFEYYAECAEDADFTSIIHNTGWIKETSCEFTGLQLGLWYWYRLKAKNSAGAETEWSNIESSHQVKLADFIGALDTMLEPETLKSKNLKGPLLNKINVAVEMIDEGLYEDALSKLRNDILQKTNGCIETGEPDKNDWIITCEQQSVTYPLIIETIEYVNTLMEQSPN
ncbi:MAG: GLUG motif-containing protein [Planctomycetota bacterium]